MARPPQKTVAELAEMADKHLADTWDTDQPLYRWLRAIKHLANEAKSYDKDGSNELALIRFFTIQRLVEDILPTHPEWNQLPERNMQTVQSEAAALRPAQERLKQQIYSRTLTHTDPSRSPSLAPGTDSSLTLRHTVQPAADSMDTPSAPYSANPPPPPQPKLRAADKLKKKLGLGKKSSSSSLAVIGEALRPGSAPPSTGTSVGRSVAEEDEVGSESGEEGWTDLGRPRSRSPQLERPRSRASSGVGTPVAAAGTGYGQRLVAGPSRGTSYGSQASGREEGARSAVDEWRSRSAAAQREAERQEQAQAGIAYTRVGAPAWDAVPVRTSYATSAHTTDTYQSAYNSSAGPSRSSTTATSYHDHSGPAYVPTTATSYDDTVASLAAGASIQRAPSRLTTTHQRQQGFYPSIRRNARHPASSTLPEEVSALSLQEPDSGHGLPGRAPDRSLELSASAGPQAYADSASPRRPTLPTVYQSQPRQPHIPTQQQTYPQSVLVRTLPQSSQSYPNSTSPTKPFRPLPVPPLERPKPPPTPNSFARANPIHPQPLPRQAPQLPPLHEPLHTHSVPAVVEPARLARSGSVSAMPFLPPERGERAALATTEDGLPLRNVVIPAGLTAEFERRAEANTRRGIETCGLLMARLVRNEFVITHLLIPKQEGTVDTCNTTHEEEQFAFQDKHDLLTVGWIHTHPEFSCFMSSLDLHTHASYQSMLAEAIAIVVAPHETPNVGVFRLTSPVGIDLIQDCREPGAFHPHPDMPIYTDSDPWYGHARMRDVAFETVDLRKKSRW